MPSQVLLWSEHFETKSDNKLNRDRLFAIELKVKLFESCVSGVKSATQMKNGSGTLSEVFWTGDRS